MTQHWVRCYILNITDEWRDPPRTWVGWVNRVLPIVNLRIVKHTDHTTGHARLAVIRLMHSYDYDGLRAGITRTWLT